MTLRRRLLLSAVALLAGLAAILWAVRARGGGGALRVTPDPVDFGVVPWLETRVTPVEIRNVSDREILLKDLRFDCSCFTAVSPPDAVRLAPGRATKLEVLLYTPSTTATRFRKLLIVESNDPVTPRLEVPMVGHIVDFRSVTPREVTFGAIPAEGEPVTRRIEARGGEGYEVRVASAAVTDPRLVVEVVPATGGSDVVLHTVKGAAKGRLAAQVRLDLDVSSPERGTHRYADAIWVHGEFR